MPRGYYRNIDNVSNKKARGKASHTNVRGGSPKLPARRFRKDSSHSNWNFVPDDLCDPRRDGYTCWEDDSNHHVYDENGDDSLNTAITAKTARNVRPEECCPICYEIVPVVVKLMKNCKHASACYPCLREMYVRQAPSDISCYPLRCFEPTCALPLTDANLIRHGIFRSAAELTRHRRLKILAKGSASSAHASVIHCPFCEYPRLLPKQIEMNLQHHHQSPQFHRYSNRVFTCRECGKTYSLVGPQVVDKGVVEAVDNFVPDKFGQNDGWARCPKCGVLISKGDGCSHMKCICGLDFNWNEAVQFEMLPASGHIRTIGSHTKQD